MSQVLLVLNICLWHSIPSVTYLYEFLSFWIPTFYCLKIIKTEFPFNVPLFLIGRGWLLVIVTYALIIQVPQLAMAPYIGNLLTKVKDTKVLREGSLNGECYSKHWGPQSVISYTKVSKCTVIMVLKVYLHILRSSGKTLSVVIVIPYTKVLKSYIIP